MSVTFGPVINYNQEIPATKLVWDSYYLERGSHDWWPHSMKRQEEITPDIGHWIWEQGIESILFWTQLAARLQMPLVEDYTF